MKLNEECIALASMKYMSPFLQACYSAPESLSPAKGEQHM